MEKEKFRKECYSKKSLPMEEMMSQSGYCLLNTIANPLKFTTILSMEETGKAFLILTICLYGSLYL